MTKFWMVMRHHDDVEQPAALRPVKKHPRAHLAFSEAKRLAAQHPGETFYVMVAFQSIRLPFEIKQTKEQPRTGGDGARAVADGEHREVAAPVESWDEGRTGVPPDMSYKMPTEVPIKTINLGKSVYKLQENSDA